MKQTLCSVNSNAEVVPGIHLMWVEAPDIAVAAQPGQFVTVCCGDFTLRRPFSVHQVSSHEIALLFKVAGKGTFWLSQRQKGDAVDVLGPLGNGFNIPPTKSGKPKHLLLVAGGIGIAPLVFLMQRASSQHRITLIYGTRTAAQLYPRSCQLTAISYQRIQFVPVTEDGSTGQEGMATEILPDFLDRADHMYACGPVDMYKAMAEMPLRVSMQPGRSNLKLKKCQISLEVRMGCGFGACYACTINTKKGSKQVCRDGPVFHLGDVIWQEVTI
jgi:dihydroorotate dehydrogenase electron transfer subunit